MPERRPVALWACVGAALSLSITALWTSVSALDRLKAQSRIDLSMSLQRQFDSDYKQDRADCARAFLYADKKKKPLDGSPYPYLMDFFDSLGYLVERQAVDEEMARRSFAYYLDHYLEATRKLLLQEQKQAPRRYEYVFKLAQRWHEDAPAPDLEHFFQHELDFATPASADEAPRL